MRGVWRLGVASAVAVLMGCASGGEQTSTTAASLGDGASTGEQSTDATSERSTGAADGATNEVSGPTSAATNGADSTDSGSDSSPGSSSESTTASSLGCDEDPAACTAWSLPTGDGVWNAEALDAESPLAPTEVVRAAFDIEGLAEGMVLTDSRLHVVDLNMRRWVRSDSRVEILPDLGDDEIRAAYSVPAYWGADPNATGVTFISATAVYQYRYEIDSQAFVFDSSTMMFGESWDVPEAPGPATVRSAWLDVTNAPGWYSADIMALCGAMGDPGPYAGFVAGTNVHVADAGYCFEFDVPVSMMNFPPFGLPGAPSAGNIGASLYNESAGLWVFRGE